MKKITCIVCPVGCHLIIDDNTNVTGNKCIRGEKYALNEMINPRRMLTTTVQTVKQSYPRLPVKTTQPIPKHQMLQVMCEINSILVKSDVKIGDIIIENVLNTNSDIIATKDLKI